MGRDSLANLPFESRELVPVLVEDAGRVDGDRRGEGAREDAEKGVIIFLADRVELVVVAACAGNGESEKGLRHRVDLVVRETDPLVEGIGRGEAVEDHAKVTGSKGAFVEFQLGVDPWIVEKIAREMFEDQSVDGHVLIEGPNEIVAVTPCAGDRWISLAAVGVGIADPVHPVACPSFAKSRGGEQGVDEPGPLLVREGLPVVDDRGLLAEDRRGRQSGEIEGKPSQEGAWIGGRRRFETFSGEAGADEAIDRMRRSGPFGNGRIGDRTEAPPLRASSRDRGPVGVPGDLFGRRWAVPRVGRSHGDPLAYILEDRRIQLRAVLRHLEIVDLVGERAQEQARAGVGEVDDGSGVASLLPARS